VKSITAILLLISISAFTQTYSEVILDKNVLDFMTWRLNRDSIKSKQFVCPKIMLISGNSLYLSPKI
jgi:hypothetical protein